MFARAAAAGDQLIFCAEDVRADDAVQEMPGRRPAQAHGLPLRSRPS